MRVFKSLIILLGMLFATGCQSTPLQAEGILEINASPSTSPSSTPVPDLPSPTQAAITPDRMEVPMTKVPERIPPTEAIPPLTGEVPSEVLDSILKDLTGHTGAAPENINVIQAQAVVWNDGSLGCPQPGVMYTQALVNGYWIILEAGGQKFDYRANETGYFLLCESGLPPVAPPSTPTS